MIGSELKSDDSWFVCYSGDSGGRKRLPSSTALNRIASRLGDEDFDVGSSRSSIEIARPILSVFFTSVILLV